MPKSLSTLEDRSRPTADHYLHKFVARELRSRISLGVYASGMQIPSVADLVHEFRVSAITVRRAIQSLCLEGLLQGHQGRGVFVATKPRIQRTIQVDYMAAFEEEMRRAGVEPAIREISLTLLAADDAGVRDLGFAPDVSVYRMERIILADGEPVSLDIAWMPQPLGEKLKPTLTNTFLMPVLLSHGVPLDHIDFKLEGGAASDADAASLGVPTGFPLLRIDYAILAARAVPLMKGSTASRADRFTYAFCGRPERHPGGPPGARTRSTD
ncbi:MAG: GntR family transcriptional regulator [Alphaproteobacteria bacterium]